MGEDPAKGKHGDNGDDDGCDNTYHGPDNGHHDYKFHVWSWFGCEDDAASHHGPRWKSFSPASLLLRASCPVIWAQRHLVGKNL